jgi:hypothetical protein
VTIELLQINGVAALDAPGLNNEAGQLFVSLSADIIKASSSQSGYWITVASRLNALKATSAVIANGNMAVNSLNEVMKASDSITMNSSVLCRSNTLLTVMHLFSRKWTRM